MRKTLRSVDEVRTAKLGFFSPTCVLTALLSVVLFACYGFTTAADPQTAVHAPTFVGYRYMCLRVWSFR